MGMSAPVPWAGMRRGRVRSIGSRVWMVKRTESTPAPTPRVAQYRLDSCLLLQSVGNLKGRPAVTCWQTTFIQRLNTRGELFRYFLRRRSDSARPVHGRLLLLPSGQATDSRFLIKRRCARGLTTVGDLRVHARRFTLM